MSWQLQVALWLAGLAFFLGVIANVRLDERDQRDKRERESRWRA